MLFTKVHFSLKKPFLSRRYPGPFRLSFEYSHSMSSSWWGDRKWILACPSFIPFTRLTVT